MNETLQLALSKIAIPKTARAAVAVGEHEIDATIRVKGIIKVGEDYDTAPTVGLPLLEIVALLLHRAGATREASIALLREVATEAMKITEGKSKGSLESLPEVEAMLKTVQDEYIAKLPRANRKGVVTAKLAVEEVV